MPKCSIDSCTNEAIHQIGIKIWSLRIAPINRSNQNSLKILTNVSVCERCKPLMNREHFMDPEQLHYINTAIRKLHGPMPNFASMELHFQNVKKE